MSYNFSKRNKKEGIYINRILVFMACAALVFAFPVSISAFDETQDGEINEIITATPGVTGENPEPESEGDVTGVKPGSGRLVGGWWGSSIENEIVDISPVYEFSEMYTPEFCWLLAIGEEFDDSQLPKCADAWVRNPSDGENHLVLEIQWTFKIFDAPGLQAMEGYVEIPDGYNLRDGLTNKVELPVLICDPAQPIAATQVDLYLVGKTVPLGMNEAEVYDYFATNESNYYFPNILIELENGSICNGKIIGIDMDLLDTSTVGTYYPFIIEMSPGIMFDKREMPGTEIYIRDFDEVYLCDFTERVGGGSIVTFWEKIIYEPELWMSIDGGKWEFADFETVAHRISGNQMTIFLSSLSSGHVYEFEVRYENGGYSADTLIVDLTGDKTLCSSGLGGSRDGDGREEQPETELPVSPPVIPPETPEPPPETSEPPNSTPETDNNPANTSTGKSRTNNGLMSSQDAGVSSEDASDIEQQQPRQESDRQATETVAPVTDVQSAATLSVSPVAEQNGTDFTTLSGKRLMMMLENSNEVTFVKNGVQLLLPAEIIKSLDIDEDSLFTVAIQRADKKALNIAFYLDGHSLSDTFPVPFDILYPYIPEPNEDPENLVCADTRGRHVSTSYDPQDKKLFFSLDAGGEYSMISASVPATIMPPSSLRTVQPEESQQPPLTQPQQKPIWFIAAICCVPIALVSYLVIWLRVKR